MNNPCHIILNIILVSQVDAIHVTLIGRIRIFSIHLKKQLKAFSIFREQFWINLLFRINTPKPLIVITAMGV